MNHSCAPTVELVLYAPDADGEYQNGIGGEVRVARDRDLAVGDELTFFYPSTEWDCVSPFRYLCGLSSSSKEEGKRCIRTQRGSKYLSDEVLGRYLFNKHIHSFLAEEKGRN